MKENGGNSKCSFRKSYGRYLSTFHKNGKWGALISKIISFNFCIDTHDTVIGFFELACAISR